MALLLLKETITLKNIPEIQLNLPPVIPLKCANFIQHLKLWTLFYDTNIKNGFFI